MIRLSRSGTVRWQAPGLAALAFCGYWILRPQPWTGSDVFRSLVFAASLGALCAQLRRSAPSAVALLCVALVGFSPAVLMAGRDGAGWIAASRFALGVLALTLAVRTDVRAGVAFGGLVGWLACAAPTDIALLLVPPAMPAQRRARLLAVMTASCAASWLLGCGLGHATSVTWALPAPLDGLWSPRGGLLYWQPVLWLSILALLTGFRRRPAAALWRAAPVLLLALWPSASHVATRWIVLLPFLVTALVRPFDRVLDLTRRRAGLVLAGAGLVLLVSNELLMAQYREPGFPRDQTVSFVDLEEGNARILTRALGSPLTWPASWVFAWRSGLPAWRYEQLAGRSLFHGADALGGRLDVGDDLALETILLGEGWGVRHVSNVGVCREVLGRAEVYAPLDRPARLNLAVTASGAGTLVLWRDEIRQAEFPISPALPEVRVPALDLPAGLTIFTLEAAPGGTVCVALWDLADAGPPRARPPDQN